MTDPLFFLPELADPLPAVGAVIELGGPEGHHAAVVRRIRVGETVRLGDGAGRGIAGTVVEATKRGLRVEVTEVLSPTPVSPVRFVAAQAPAKGDRSELAVEMLTEVGVDEIVPWQASRAVVRWSGERTAKARARWITAAREAAKQSRRLVVPAVAEPVSTAELIELIKESELALVLHEAATTSLAEVPLPTAGQVMIIIGPEGGIAPEELTAFTEAGGRTVLLGDGVLRASTAGVVALAGLRLR
ncbi:16S rRNA (uracil(1498)-N(3))-methyltransferase [Microlunatus speluncae]|uniref:16S rRNA (uracil(1498)-N(3))-methyltransferase n=1 Tax=Microlunatus speluncae TaxID=2594267 RepID=UPI0012666A91|nr:16S rRNA (uracil(1498)-N(3))-methyltransferase [Microlunatus speluncae]